MNPYLRQEVALTCGVLAIAAVLIGLATVTYWRTVDGWEDEQQQQRREVAWDWQLPT